MEKDGVELALGGLVGVVIGELHEESVDAALPEASSFTGDLALPFVEVVGLAIGGFHRLCDEAKGVLFAPVAALLGQSLLCDVHESCFFNFN